MASDQPMLGSLLAVLARAVYERFHFRRQTVGIQVGAGCVREHRGDLNMVPPVDGIVSKKMLSIPTAGGS
jgi:hypothetical protein